MGQRPIRTTANKNILATDASSGIGKATSKAFFKAEAAALPPVVTVQFITIMTTNMPDIGRG